MLYFPFPTLSCVARMRLVCLEGGRACSEGARFLYRRSITQAPREREFFEPSEPGLGGELDYRNHAFYGNYGE